MMPSKTDFAPRSCVAVVATMMECLGGASKSSLLRISCDSKGWAFLEVGKTMDPFSVGAHSKDSVRFWDTLIRRLPLFGDPLPPAMGKTLA